MNTCPVRAACPLAIGTLLYSITFAQASTPAASATSLEATLGGSVEVVFSWKSSSCGTWTMPDGPARAYVDGHSQTHLVAGSSLNWMMIGSSLDTVSAVCRSTFTGHNLSALNAFDSTSWIEGTYTDDGSTVVALLSNDWALSEPNQTDKNLPAPCYGNGAIACHFMSITESVSVNEGGSFGYQTGSHLVAAQPSRYLSSVNSQVGDATISNMFRVGDYVYTFIGARGPQQIGVGSCLVRSEHVFDPLSWHVWNGSDFTNDFTLQHDADVLDMPVQACKPVTVPGFVDAEFRSINFLPAANKYVAVFEGSRTTSKGIFEKGFFYSTSQDLLVWSSAIHLLDRPFDSECKPMLVYPTLLDPVSSDRNFFNISMKSYLYFTRINRTSCNGTADRDLVRIPVAFTIQ